MEEKNKWFHFIHEYLVDQGLSEINASYLNTFLLFVLLIALIALVDYVLWKVIRSATTRLARKTKTNFDNLMVANRLPRHLAHIFPLLLALELLPLVFYDFDYAGSIAMKVLYIIWVVVILRIIRSFLHTLKDYLKTLPRFKDKPIDSYIQVFMIFAWAAGIMGIIAIMFEVGLWKFFTGLGAASAVILLIFRDTILGFVASMQVSINDMVRIGDWITFEKYGADGDVIEITLATVKVQNFDIHAGHVVWRAMPHG